MVIRPWAVAVIGVPPGATPSQARAWARRERVRTAIDSDERRYALLDIVELTGDPEADEEAMRQVEHLACTYPVQAFLIDGTVDVARLEHLAEVTRVLIVQVPPLAPSVPSRSPEAPSPPTAGGRP